MQKLNQLWIGWFFASFSSVQLLTCVHTQRNNVKLLSTDVQLQQRQLHWVTRSSVSHPGLPGQTQSTREMPPRAKRSSDVCLVRFYSTGESGLLLRCLASRLSTVSVGGQSSFMIHLKCSGRGDCFHFGKLMELGCSVEKCAQFQ